MMGLVEHGIRNTTGTADGYKYPRVTKSHTRLRFHDPTSLLTHPCFSRLQLRPTIHQPHSSSSRIALPTTSPSSTPTMWEDNNPLAYDDESPTFDHFPGTSDYAHHHLSHDSDNDSDNEHASSPPASPDSHKPPPTFLTRTPSERSRDDEHRSNTRPLSKEEEEDEEYRRMRREHGYSGRVEQMLLERDNVEIEITDAGKNHEGTGGFIVYTIKTGVCTPTVWKKLIF